MTSIVKSIVSYFSKVATKLTGSQPPSRKSKRTKSDGGYLYAFPTKGSKETYKVGKTIDLKSRKRKYNTLIPGIDYSYTVKCPEIHRTEQILHGVLRLAGFHIQQEVYSIPLEVLKKYMNVVCSLANVIKKTSEYSDRDQIRVLEQVDNYLKKL